MYNMMTIKDRIRLPPQFFSMKLEDALAQILREKYERRMDRETGMMLSIWNVKPDGDGIVIPGDGAAYYSVSFDALSYLPSVNEIVEAQVSELVEFGAFVGLGPIEGLVHLSQIANDFLTYNKKTGTFSGRESKKVLKKEDIVLAKISTVSMKNTIADAKIGLTMRPDGLGKYEWIGEGEKSRAAKADVASTKGKKKEKAA